MSIFGKLLKLSSAYLVGEVLITFAGFISFPIFARILTKEEYGIMSLISITISIVEEFSSIGLRHASQRFYSTYLDSGTEKSFYSTTIFSSIVSGVVGTAAVFVITTVLSLTGVLPYNVKNVFAIASLLITVRVLFKVTGCLFRVRAEANKYAFFAVLAKYIGMLFSILFVSSYLYGIYGFYLGLVLGESIVLVIFFTYMARRIELPRAQYSGTMLRHMVAYGLPLVISGLGGMLLTVGSRYVIGYYMAATEVAVYSVYYNLCTYLTSIFVTAFEYAFIPLIMSEWQKSDKAHIQSQLQHVVKLYCLVALPTIFGISALGERVIILLASQKYAGESYILPYIITGELLKGLMTPLVLGLNFYNNTKVMIKFTWYAVLLNVALNVILVPTMGLLGAAITALASYVVLIILGVRAASAFLPVKIPWAFILRYCMAGIVMFAVLKTITSGQYVTNLALLVMTGMAVYTSFLLATDKELRQFTAGFVSKASGRAGRKSSK